MAKRCAMVMVDGFGVPPEGWRSSVYARACGLPFAELFERSSKPIDARLGVEGLPQSASGQTALFTGVNAPLETGRHLQGFPGPSLRKIIERGNLFSQALASGLKPLFANAYANHSLEELERRGLRSVTTVMLASSGGKPLGYEELKASKALYHDIVREALLKAGRQIETISPEKAARDFWELSKSCDLLLFEHFMTDRAGHKRDPALLERTLALFGRFITALAEELPSDAALIVTSDHGNCEDPSVATHTLNPVPLLALGGYDKAAFEKAKDLTDVMGFVLASCGK